MVEQKQSFDVLLTGCRPEPLALYLKALGVLRLVAEQKDADASGCWRGEHFLLRSALDREALIRFFMEEWRPTPVIAPWNGGSGFYPKDNSDAPEAIVASADKRLDVFAASIKVAREFIKMHGWTERPADEDKSLLLQAMRSLLPDEALAWLDAAVVIGDDRPLFPPLLGTGGNDGRLDFSNNFQQRVVDVIVSPSTQGLESSLFGTTATSAFKGAMGQYQPAANERSNPWDFVLLIEGALVLAGAATRRLETSSSSATMAFPFHAHAAGGVPSVADSDEDESRGELWLPVWSAAATIREIRRLFSEGRAKVGQGERARPAGSALDFARAVTSLGVDRGIDGFTRVGFHVRNGLAYYATPLGRFATGEVRSARLLDDVDVWFDKFRRRSSGKNVSAQVAAARRRLERAMFEAAAAGNLGPVLLALGDADGALARSLSFSSEARLGPVRRLPSQWLVSVADQSLEQRLAAALAARRGMRARMIPLDPSGVKFGRGDEPGQVFAERSLIDNLHAVLLRDDIESQQQTGGPPEEPRTPRCSLADIARFIDGDVDDVLVERWLRALVLVDGDLIAAPQDDELRPPGLFAVLALTHNRRVHDGELPRTTGLLARACAGDAAGASAAAIRRLGASGCPFPIPAITEPVGRTRRIAAALAFPLTKRQRQTLESMVLPAVDVTNQSGSLQEPA